MSKILLVDDDADVRHMLHVTLEKLGHTVVTAGNGNEAVACQEREPVDVMLTDIVMPQKEGLETILEFRRKFPQVKIIAMSGGGRVSPTDYLKIAKQMGASELLIKPFSPTELAAAIDKLNRPPG